MFVAIKRFLIWDTLIVDIDIAVCLELSAMSQILVDQLANHLAEQVPFVAIDFNLNFIFGCWTLERQRGIVCAWPFAVAADGSLALSTCL